jgi:maltose alpha-D-glucosyltransferase/alpha-amylase
MMLDLWYKNAILYCVDVETYRDGNGDGIGDFVGLSERLDYLAGLGVTCLWVLPFYRSPNRDNGYDVSDFYSVDPRYGSLGDFVEFAHQAKLRGLKIVLDLVVNHTSDQHPWFQEARSDKSSKYRSWYIWSKKKPKSVHRGMVFPGVQNRTWSYDRKAGEYYFHRFYPFQPDLNTSNPEVREEIFKIMGFWLELGISGFRIDAVPFVIEQKGPKSPDSAVYDYDFLRQMHDFLSWRTGEATMLAEANVTMDEVREYLGKEGDRMHMTFNFMANQHLFLALARRQAEPLIRGMKMLPKISPLSQWANFLRNQDELDLGRLSQKEREECFAEFAPDKNMQLYGRGIRRALAPMLKGDWRRLKLAYSLMFTLPGTPVLVFGNEIGMGEDLSLPERNCARTPMHWSRERNGGFSHAPPEALVRPVIADGPYGYEHLNVASQRREPGSFYNWMERLIRIRKECMEFGWGSWRLLEADHPAVFAHCCEWKDRIAIALHNLGEEACTVSLKLDGLVLEHFEDEFGDHNYEDDAKDGRNIQLEGYGFRWLRGRADQR